MISLLNELFIDLPENEIPTILKLQKENGLLDMVNSEFLRNNVPCDYDVLSFYIKFQSLVQLHFKEENTIESYKANFLKVFEIVFYKKMVCNNIRRYLWNYVNDTLKNLGEEIIETFNIHSHMKTFLHEQVIKLDQQMLKIETFLSELIVSSKDKDELKKRIIELEPSNFLKQKGWF